MAATLFNLDIPRGRTLDQVVRWESEPWIHAHIIAINNAVPVEITTQAAHGIPDGWNVAVVGAKGLISLNAIGNPPKAKDFRKATLKNTVKIEFNGISTALDPVYQIGGFLQWYTPVSLAGCVGRMTIKDKVGGAVLLEMTTVNNRIVLNDTNKTIRLKLTATETAALAFNKGVYDLEIEDAGGVVTAILTGSVNVLSEVTT